MNNTYHCLFVFNNNFKVFIIESDLDLPQIITNFANLILIDPPEYIVEKDRYGLFDMINKSTIEKVIEYIRSKI